MPIRAERDEIGDGHVVEFVFKIEDDIIYRQAQEDKPSSKWSVYSREKVDDGEELANFLQERGFDIRRMCGKSVWPYVHACILEPHQHGNHRDVRGREFDNVRYIT